MIEVADDDGLAVLDPEVDEVDAYWAERFAAQFGGDRPELIAYRTYGDKHVKIAFRGLTIVRDCGRGCDRLYGYDSAYRALFDSAKARAACP